ncbi:MAG: HAD hydrolase-like protein, partial [Planctomycetaceae bacterium]|nr:HAD hydrolase-like protein [Planctomycetaceae bacterium]
AKDYVQKIRRLGLRCQEDNLYTSSLATIDFLRNNYPSFSTIYLLGTESLKTEFIEAGYRVLSGEEPDEPDAVVVAFDVTLTYAKLCKTAWWVKQGKPYLATHPDIICPTDLPTILVDCGAVCHCIASVTGRRPDHVSGKPNRLMIDGIVQKYGLKPNEIGMVGDRLYTDIEMAQRAGIIGILVLSGEATLSELAKSVQKPDFIFDTIFDLAREIKRTKTA